MPVQSPSCQWPETLHEQGPPEDPSILLGGQARIGEVEVRIVAIRVDPERVGTPGYRAGVAAAAYQADELEVVLEAVLDDNEYIGSDLERWLGERRQSIVELPTGSYLILMVPWSFAG
jgi:hypothetical protein